MTKTIREFHQYIAPDGLVYELHTASKLGRWVMQSTGWGTPPIDYITERGPAQHGETVKDFFLRPRVVQLLIHQSFCDRDGQWDGRADLLNAIRPNRQLTPTATVPGQLRRVLSDGSLRDLDVFITQGPEFDPGGGEWREHSFHEVLRFIAHDPVIYDPTLQTMQFDLNVGGELVFPITFPIIFGASYIWETKNLTYPGTWLSYPTIIITGPINDPTVENLTTGEKISLDYNIPVGRTVTIDLAYGVKTVVNDLGVNLIGTLTSDSDLATFHIAADPEAPLGVNQMRASGYFGIPGITQITLRYYIRYFGI